MIKSIWVPHWPFSSLSKDLLLLQRSRQLDGQVKAHLEAVMLDRLNVNIHGDMAFAGFWANQSERRFPRSVLTRRVAIARLTLRWVRLMQNRSL